MGHSKAPKIEMHKRAGISTAGTQTRARTYAPLSHEERKRWERLEASPAHRALRDRMHDAQMMPGIGLCATCLGFVDDPRHLAVGVWQRRVR